MRDQRIGASTGAMALRQDRPRNRLREVLIALVAAAFVVGALSIPARAVEPATVFVVNGLPGKKLDLCQGSKEIASWVKYGRSKAIQVGPGTTKIKVREARKGTCNGKWLASRDVTFHDGGNDALVVWRPFRKIVIKRLVNDITLPGPDTSTINMTHTARMGLVDGYIWQMLRSDDQQLRTPAGDHFWEATWEELQKGERSPSVTMKEEQTLIEAYPARPTSKWSYEGRWFFLKAGFAFQTFIVGSKRENYHIVIIAQPGVLGP
jgi:hypothetical protein